MTSRGKRLLAGVMVSVICLASPAFACESAGSNTHVGEIKAIDLGQPSLTVLDRQTKKPITFQVAPEQLKGLSLGQQVAVKYSKSGEQLRAEEILAR